MLIVFHTVLFTDARAAAGLPVSAADRLGDTLINGASKTGRHNMFNRACRDALAATTNHEVILGDKGDGSPRARAVALQRYAWANEGHVPDIIHKNAADNGMHELFESKVYTAAKTTNNKGGGTAKGVTRAAARPRPLRLRAATLH